MRTIITIDDDEVAALTKLCEQKGWSRAKGFREGVRLLLKQHKQVNEVDVFGIWQDRNIDGLEYQQDLRSEWE